VRLETAGAKDSGPCGCCGNMTRKAWGYVHDGTTRADRVLVSMELRWMPNGPSFVVIDAATRPVSESNLVGRALARADVIGHPIADQVFELADVVWVSDERIAEITQGSGRTKG